MTRWDVAYKTKGADDAVHVEIEAEQPADAIETVRAGLAETQVVSSIRRLD